MIRALVFALAALCATPAYAGPAKRTDVIVNAFRDLCPFVLDRAEFEQAIINARQAGHVPGLAEEEVIVVRFHSMWPGGPTVTYDGERLDMGRDGDDFLCGFIGLHFADADSLNAALTDWLGAPGEPRVGPLRANPYWSSRSHSASPPVRQHVVWHVDRSGEAFEIVSFAAEGRLSLWLRRAGSTPLNAPIDQK